MTQSQRLLGYLRANPGSSSLELTAALRLVNVTGRVSDLRAQGHDVQAIRDRDAVWRYAVREELTLGLVR